MLDKLDTLLSPPPDYAKMTYQDRLKWLLHKIMTFKNYPSCLINFTVLGGMMGLGYLLWPVAYVLKKAGYRFTNVDLSQIGSVLYLDLYIRDDKLTRQTPRHKFLVLGSYTREGNAYLFDLYKEHITLIRNPLMKFLLYPFYVSPVFADDAAHKFESVNHTQTVAHQVWNDYADSHQKPLISMPQADKDKAADLLNTYIPKGVQFVPIHIRETGFYEIESQNTRNGDIYTYKAAIHYLIENGYAVVRVGDSRMSDITALMEECGPMLFDYARSDIKSEMLDIYLFSQCAFMIGCSSGPNCVPPCFHVNCVNVNWYNASNAPFFTAGDISSFKKFRYKADNRLVPFEELMLPPFSKNPQMQTLEEMGIFLEDSTQEEILSTVREFVETDTSRPTALQEKAKSYLRPENYAVGAKGNYSQTILKLYFEEG